MIDPVERARALVGTPFRLQGRGGGDGIDCLGLVLDAFTIPSAAFPRNYGWRGHDRATFERAARQFFEHISEQTARPGDAVAFALPGRRHHLAIMSDRGFIHADAVRRKVVERSGTFGAPAIGAFRRLDSDKGDCRGNARSQ
ncbi:NlpC/P60 family protein [Sphingomicrobium arenosum]|uniref:NlpC/P60 family protein n=1 Tax=Sphingomicrobium arenosum TaxID=2233861 RepID=UPI00223EBB8F|nr:NlpC/P60 family protein [Sphingomicrobium arenosum]